MKKIFTLILISSVIVFAQTYKGPSTGNVSGGVTVTTDAFTSASPIKQPQEEIIRNKVSYVSESQYYEFPTPTPPEGSNYYEDKNVNHKLPAGLETTILLKNFPGIAQTNSIPPDPYCAAGPTHVMAVVNSRFAIWDKEGNMLKNIDADMWYQSALNPPSAFDPKVLYDHFDKRWIMVWLNQSDNLKTSYFLVSVSDDSIPLGTWYNWALPSNTLGDSAVDNWADYQGVGFDKDAIYLSANQFQFGGSFQYVKIRIIPKQQLYANTAGSVSWKDIWDITYPQNSSKVFNIRPSITYGTPSEYYLMHAPGGGSNYMVVYNITDPLSNPVLRGNLVPVTLYSAAPNADQLGGSTTLIEGGGSAIRNEPKYRNGYLWAVHSIRNPLYSNSSSLRYVKVDVSNYSAVDDAAMGAENYWHIYPAITIDKDENVAITYSRSGLTEYPGAFYTTRLKNDPPGLSGSVILQEGKGNYVKTFGSGRNRWGDYNGIWTDPTDESNIWIFSEYSAGLNTWGTWNGLIRLVPFPGYYLFTEKPILDFGTVELNKVSDTLTSVIKNYGTTDLIISNIPSTIYPFSLVSNHQFPLTLASYDSVTVKFLFSPIDSNDFNLLYPVTNNDAKFSGFQLKGKGYKINTASEKVLYAVSGSGNNGNMSVINRNSGSGLNIGSSRYNDIVSLSIQPKTKVLYGLLSTLNSSSIVRVNALGGDSYELFSVNIGNMAGIAFDTSGTLFGITKTGNIYEVDLARKEFKELVNANATTSDIAFNPFTNELWAAGYVVIGIKDKIFKINLTNGDTTLIGRTGLNLVTNAIAFDHEGKLLGVTGSNLQENNLISIDTATGAGQIIGSTGIKHITGLAYHPGTITGISEPAEVANLPVEFILSQNYPNPFNPSTTIEFSLPEISKVKLIVYNLLGEAVTTLIDQQLSGGNYKINWNTNESRRNISSGIYFYELKASSVSGKEYKQLKKMILLK